MSDSKHTPTPGPWTAMGNVVHSMNSNETLRLWVVVNRGHDDVGKPTVQPDGTVSVVSI